MLRPEAQAGLFGYNVTVAGAQQRQTVDLIALARANGQVSALDPTMVRLLDKIRSGAQSTGTINDTGAGNTLQVRLSRAKRSAISTRRPDASTST